MDQSVGEKKALEEIRKWEEELFLHEPNDFQLTFDKMVDLAFSYLPEKAKEEFFANVDTWLFHMNAFIQSLDMQKEAEERILLAGRAFREDILSISDMKKLPIEKLQFIAEQQIVRHRVYSFVQGAFAGTGQPLFLGADLPAVFVINMRAVQLIAASYGCEVNTPFEMMASLKVFHCAAMPKRIKKQGWRELIDELENGEQQYFYGGNEKISGSSSIEYFLKQVLKGMAILLFKNRKLQNIPLLSMAIGAGANYQLTKQVTDFAKKYYQMRYLLEQNK